ncbi:uncharacterized protein [Apostichopus japonicus]|uniref:uncharacterized protein n=1 Tax=Stichopus japonicus TaxID=307972 RepID=UPI003AB239C0
MATPEPTTDPEGKPDPEYTGEPYAEPEVVPTGDPEVEPEMVATAEPEVVPEAVPELVASVPVVLSPVGVILLFILAIIITYFVSKFRRRKMQQERRDNCNLEASVQLSTFLDIGESQESKEQHQEQMNNSPLRITNDDVTVMEKLEKAYNHPASLLRIISPAIVSVAISPIVLLMHDPIVLFFWGGASRNINDAIACFLGPAGLVYAVNFGFTFQSVLEKQQSILSTVSSEVGILHQILEMSQTFQTLSTEQKIEILSILKKIAICILKEIQESLSPGTLEVSTDYRYEQIWQIIRILNEKAKCLRETELVLTDKIVSNIQTLVSLASTRKMYLSSRIHALQWGFLELLGFFSFFGIMLIDAGSVQVELVMCVITVLSITVLCFIIADMDSPFSGYFSIDLSFVWELVEKISDWEDMKNEVHI